MTNTIDILNNMQEMVAQKTVANKIGTASGMDKSMDFAKVFDSKNTEVIEQKGSLTLGDIKDSKVIKHDTSSTLGDIKNATFTDDKMIEFREILQKATSEANDESSLDLTLARDINEIIAELKESLKEYAENNGLSSEETVLDDPNAVFEQLLISTGIVKPEILDETQQLTGAIAVEDSKAVFEQLLISTGLVKPETLSNIQQLNEDVTVDNTLMLETESASAVEEVLEYVSNSLSDDVVVEKPVTTENDIESLLDDDMLGELNIEAVEAETDADADTSQDEGLMQKQSAEEHGVKTSLNLDAESFDLKIDNVVAKNSSTQAAKPVVMTSEKLVEQIAKQLEGLYNSSKVNIVLNPESLGKVNIQLMTSKDGLIAQFVVDTPEARDLLMKGLEGLKEALGTHGVSVDNVSVKLSSAQKGGDEQDWTEQEGSRGGNKQDGRSDKEEKEKGLFEKMMAQSTEKENGNVEILKGGRRL